MLSRPLEPVLTATVHEGHSLLNGAGESAPSLYTRRRACLVPSIRAWRSNLSADHRIGRGLQ